MQSHAAKDSAHGQVVTSEHPAAVRTSISALPSASHTKDGLSGSPHIRTSRGGSIAVKEQRWPFLRRFLFKACLKLRYKRQVMLIIRLRC